MKRLASVLIVVSLFASCKEKKAVEYNVKCDDCLVSYWAEDNEFVPRVEAQGNWTYSFDAVIDPTESAQVVRVSAQSQLCKDATACADTSLLEADSVYVSISIDGSIVEEHAVGNKVYAATFVETNL